MAADYLSDDLTGLMAARIGQGGLDEPAYAARLKRAEAGLAFLRAAHADGGLPLLRLPAETVDLAAIDALAAALSDKASDVVFLGTGGSSLGAQALAQVADWQVPGAGGLREGPRLHFLDNLDARSMAAFLDRLPLETTRVLTVSKSGGTAETMVQTLLVLAAFRDALGEAALKDHIFGLTEPVTEKGPNALRGLLAKFDIETHEHNPKVGGRYSALSNVGLVPARVAGLDPAKIRAGAESIIAPILAGCAAEESLPARGAAALIALEEARDINIQVLWSYADRLERLGKWYVQLWAESLGKDGRGSTPVAAVGPVDQHSQQQLYLGGPRDKAVTVIETATAGKGPRFDANLAALAGQPRFAGRNVGDLVDAMQRATGDTLSRNAVPLRVLRVGPVDEYAIGALMMHFFLETIIAGKIMGVDPFDQPAVEEGKVLARRYLDDMA